MCSIFKYKTTVGRNFDYETSYKEELKVVAKGEFGCKYQIVGMVTGLVKDSPLFYDAMNSHGLVCGGLAFTDNAVYNPPKIGKINIPSYNFILEIVGGYKSVEEVKPILDKVNIIDKDFSNEMPSSPLHWFIADSKESIVVEQTKEGLRYYAADVMTNNPPYYMQKVVSEADFEKIGKCRFYLSEFETRGKETYNLKGDYTSEGRFSRLSWLKQQLEKSNESFNTISQAFHLCSSVEQIFGVTNVNGKFEYTIYTVIYDMENKTIYLKGYNDLEIKYAKL